MEILPLCGCVFTSLAAGVLSARVGLSLGFFRALFGPGLALAGTELTLFLCSHVRKSRGPSRAGLGFCGSAGSSGVCQAAGEVALALAALQGCTTALGF